MVRARRRQLRMPKAPKPPKRPNGLPRIKGIKGIKGSPGLKSFPESTSSGPSGPDDPEVVRRIQTAISDRLPVTAIYAGKDGDKRHEVFPLSLGMKRGGYRLWAYQFAGETDSGWKCFVVAGLSDVSIQLGSWAVPSDDPGPGRCMDEVLQQAR